MSPLPQDYHEILTKRGDELTTKVALVAKAIQEVMQPFIDKAEGYDVKTEEGRELVVIDVTAFLVGVRMYFGGFEALELILTSQLTRFGLDLTRWQAMQKKAHEMGSQRVFAKAVDDMVKKMEKYSDN